MIRAIFLFLLTGQIFAAQIPANWMIGKENVGIDKHISSNFGKDLEEMYDLNGEILNNFAKTNHDKGIKERKFKLTEVITFLGVSHGGTVGPLGISGEAAAELHWGKKKHVHNIKKNKSHLKISSRTTEIELKNNIGPLVETLAKTGKVKNKKKLRKNLSKAALKFARIMKGVEINNGKMWNVAAVQANIAVEASGVVGIFEIGGAVELTFEWVFDSQRANSIILSSKDTEVEEGRVQKSFTKMVRIISEEVALAAAATNQMDGFKTDYFEIGFAIGVSGEIGVASVGAGVGMTVVFEPAEMSEAEKAKRIDLLKSNKSALNETITIAGPSLDKGLRDRIKERRRKKFNKVVRRKFRKGMERAFKIGRFFTKRADKREKRLLKKGKKPKYALSAITGVFALDLEGSVGVVTVAGGSAVEIEFSRDI
jgi:hypothetical protein